MAFLLHEGFTVRGQRVVSRLAGSHAVGRCPLTQASPPGSALSGSVPRPASGATQAASLFLGLLTRVSTGQAVIASAGKGRSSACSSGPFAAFGSSQRSKSAGARRASCGSPVVIVLPGAEAAQVVGEGAGQRQDVGRRLDRAVPNAF